MVYLTTYIIFSIKDYQHLDDSMTNRSSGIGQSSFLCSGNKMAEEISHIFTGICCLAACQGSLHRFKIMRILKFETVYLNNQLFHDVFPRFIIGVNFFFLVNRYVIFLGMSFWKERKMSRRFVVRFHLEIVFFFFFH